MSEREKMMAEHPSIKFNDSPTLDNGESAMFVRILDRKNTKELFNHLRSLNPQAPAYLNKNTEQFCAYAPDGDLVMSLIPTDARKAYFVCRLHKEVFVQ